MRTAQALNGFTLIEMLIAISLSIVICLTSFAAIRVASQCVTQVNHLSMNNRLLQTGISSALEDLDYWKSMDDPDSGDTPLRTMTTGAEGAAFTPIGWWGKEERQTPGSRFDVNFDQSNRKVWYTGDGSNYRPQATANYPMLTRLNHPKAVGDPTNNYWRDWYHYWIATFVNWGYYAYLDYTPANFVQALYWENGEVLGEFYEPGDTWFRLYSTAKSWGARNPWGFYELTYGTIFGLTRNTFYTQTLGDVGRRHFLWWGPGMEANYTIGDFCDKCGQDLNVLPSKPQHWSNLQVVTKHFIVEGRSFHTGTVTLGDPVNGTMMKLFVTNTGTTLRGARRQRNLDTDP